MTPNELIVQLTKQEGPCIESGRFCAYCPDNLNLAEIKECIEDMLKEIYSLRSHCDQTMRDLVTVLRGYWKATGHEFRFEED